MTRKGFAIKGLKGGITRALRHLGRLDARQAIKTLRDACDTAEQWLDRTHPKISKAIDG